MAVSVGGTVLNDAAHDAASQNLSQEPLITGSQVTPQIMLVISKGLVPNTRTSLRGRLTAWVPFLLFSHTC
jgi:hypothetical protein